jgi:hypothetical protein
VTGKSKSDCGRATSPSADDRPRNATVTRRDFLTLAGVALSSSVLPATLTACSSGGGGGAPSGPQPDFTATLIRPTDLLSVTIGFFNLSLSGDKTLNPIRPSDPAYLQVDFGPQHLLEEVFHTDSKLPDDPTSQPPEGMPLQQSLLAGHSRVVFTVPAGKSLEYSVASLLTAFRTLDMNVPGLATPNDGVMPPPHALAAKVTPIVAIRRQRLNGLRRSLGAPPLPGTPAAPSATLKPLNAPNLQPDLPSAPTGLETALELPARLQLAPNLYAGWAHALAEVTSSTSQRTELWHTRLGVRAAGVVDESDLYAAQRTVRAVWTRDPGFSASKLPPKFDPTAADSSSDSTPWAALHDADRARIVFESATPGSRVSLRTPSAIQVNRLMLTSLGGWLDVRGDFGEQPASGLAEWQQRATMGRDHYVKTVQTGVLYPWGHRAVLVTITERKLTNGAEALWQRKYIVVRQPSVTYDAVAHQESRPFAFTELKITTLSTPDLELPSEPGVALLADTHLPYAFKMVGTDHGVREVHFEAPAVWVPTQNGKIVGVSAVSDLETTFQTAMPTSSLNGQRVAFAEEVSAPAMTILSAHNPNGATFETHSLTHQGVQGPDWATGGPIPFLPQIQSASVAVEALRGFSAGVADTPLEVSYHQAFKDHGFDKNLNAGELLLQLATASGVDFSQHSDQAGGFVSPSLGVGALSRAFGPVAGAADVPSVATDLATGKFDPAALFASGLSGAKIFGVLSLTDILPKGTLDQAPKFVTQALNDIDALIADAQKLRDVLKALQDAATNQSMALPTQLATVATQLETAASDLLTQLGNAVRDATTDATAFAADVTAATSALASLPATLGQVPAALTAAAGKLPPQTANLASQLRTLADTFNQATQALGATFTTVLKAYAAGQDLVKNLALKLDWTTPLDGWPTSAPIFDPNPNGKTGGLLLSAELRLKASGGKPAGMDLLCGLEAFDIHLFGGSSTFISIHFDRLQFILKAGKKANVDVVLAKPGIVFEGPLSFVQTITSVIPLDGFSDPPGISISTGGIVASFSIPLPTLSVGVFALANISIGAGFKIPFIGDPVSVGFNFCTRENPFILTVMFLGGGGFFGIEIDPNGVKMLEAAFEVGAGIAVDFGVASGSISAMLGIYFKMEFDAKTSSNDATLTGYFRLRGEVDVLGIITASIELYLSLTYESSSGKLTGTATLDIDVSVFFFHATVSITCQKRFAGGNNDPTFWDMMHPVDYVNDPKDPMLAAPFENKAAGYNPWQEYLNAFAA